MTPRIRQWLTFGLVLSVALAACSSDTVTTTADVTTTAAGVTTTEADEGASSTTIAESELDDLIAAAQEEGELVFYGAQAAEILDEFTSAFTEEYGITVSFQRLPSGEAKARVDQELQAGRLATDVLTISPDPVWQDEHVEQIAELDPTMLPNLAALPEEYRHGTWAEVVQNYYGFVYNTDEWGPDDVPTDLRNLLEKEGIAGRIGTANPTASNFYATYHNIIFDLWGQDVYEDFWTQFVQDFDGVLSDSSAPLVQGVAAGELLFIGPTNYGQVSPLASEGAPVEMVYLDPVLRVANAILTFKDAPHPNAAMLFINWMLGQEAQDILCGGGECGSHLDVEGGIVLPDGVESIVPDLEAGAIFGQDFVIPFFGSLTSS